ncbi:hypothetical protein Gotur_027651, partial [Gossypium turneri]
FIRELVESFLLSTVEENVDGKQPNTKPGEEEAKEAIKVKKEIEGDGGRIICKLADKTNVVVHDFRGKSYVSIREFYVKNGKELPSARGVSLVSETWSTLKNSFPAIDEAITKMQSKLRDKLDHQHNRDVSNSGTAFSHEISPIETTRFDGKNYHYWAEHMELFLKQLRIAYVLTDPCPSLNISSEATSEELAQAKVAEKKWMNDDYLCHHCILSALSDNLYYQFSKKAKTAKELWEELKLVYLYEEFGTKRAQVRKVEELSRNRVKQAEHSKSANFDPPNNLGPRIRDIKKTGVPWKKRESEMHGKPIQCNYCGKKGHISKFCRNRKIEKAVNGNQNGENSTIPAVAEVNMIDSNV